MRPPSGKPCTVCPPENLCPNGPRPEHKFKYDRLTEVVYFEHFDQRVVLSFNQKGPLTLGGPKDTSGILSLSVIIPTFSGLSEIQEILKEVQTIFAPKTDLKLRKDSLLPLSLLRHLNGEQLVTCKYLTLNQGKGFLSFAGGSGTTTSQVVGGYAESVIPNCVLVALTYSQIIILRENWGKWQLVEDAGLIEGLIEKMESGGVGE